MHRLATIAPLLVLACLSSTPAQAQWSATTLTPARANVAAVTVGNSVLFAGGNTGNTYFDTVNIYDNSTGLWSQATLTQARSHIGATVVGNLALFAGGLNGATSDRIDVFDSQSRIWTTATLPHARVQVMATTVGNKALFAGGGVVGGGVQSIVDIYDASLGLPNNPAAWSMHTLSLARFGGAAISVGDLAIFAGGSGFQGVPYDRVDIYNNSTGLWSQATLSVPRLLGAEAAAVVGTRAYFGGGHDSFLGSPNMFDTIDIYDASTGIWSDKTLSVARGYVGVTAVGNSVLFAGGRLTGNSKSNIVDTLNVGTGKWSSTSVLSQPREGAAAVTIGGKAIFALGDATGSASDVVDIYEPLGVNYCTATVNSTGNAATISATGSASLASNNLVLQAVDVSNSPFLFIHAPSQAQLPFGNGFLCIGGGIIRIQPPGLASGGVAQVTVDLPSAGITLPGVRNFQCWFRDVPAGGAGFNTSDAITITFLP